MSRIIFHIDVNNAFLSWSAVYLLKNGYGCDIRTIPSVIAGDEELRHGIVLAKSPIAKKFGVKTAEPLFMARKKCPKLQVFSPNYDFYYQKSMELMEYLSQYTPIIEQFSVDECFLDFTNTKYLYDDVLSLAYKIKNEIKEKFGYTVNIGIANSKLCAKMASDFEKPDKVHTLMDDEITTKMWPIQVSELLFVGSKASLKLKELGINTIGDLANSSPEFLYKYFKNRAYDMIASAKGIDNSLVCPNTSKNKCISASRTLIEDTKDLTILKKNLLDMCNLLCIRARRDKVYANVLAITLKTKDFRGFSHQKKLSNATNNTIEVYQEVMNLLDNLNITIPIRNIGMRLGDLQKDKKEQMSLFNKKDSHDDKIMKIIDDINLKYKETKIMPAIFYKNK